MKLAGISRKLERLITALEKLADVVNFPDGGMVVVRDRDGHPVILAIDEVVAVKSVQGAGRNDIVVCLRNQSQLHLDIEPEEFLRQFVEGCQLVERMREGLRVR